MGRKKPRSPTSDRDPDVVEMTFDFPESRGSDRPKVIGGDEDEPGDRFTQDVRTEENEVPEVLAREPVVRTHLQGGATRRLGRGEPSASWDDPPDDLEPELWDSPRKQQDLPLPAPETPFGGADVENVSELEPGLGPTVPHSEKAPAAGPPEPPPGPERPRTVPFAPVAAPEAPAPEAPAPVRPPAAAPPGPAARPPDPGPDRVPPPGAARADGVPETGTETRLPDDDAPPALAALRDALDDGDEPSDGEDTISVLQRELGDLEPIAGPLAAGRSPGPPPRPPTTPPQAAATPTGPRPALRAVPDPVPSPAAPSPAPDATPARPAAAPGDRAEVATRPRPLALSDVQPRRGSEGEPREEDEEESLFAWRGVAFLLDLALVGVAAALACGLGAVVYGVDTISSDPDATGALARAFGSLVAILSGVYFTFFHAIDGQTPAKALLGLRVVDDESDEPPPPVRSFARWAGAVFSLVPLGAGLLWAWWDEDGRGWHDRVGRTLVLWEDDEADEEGDVLDVLVVEDGV